MYKVFVLVGLFLLMSSSVCAETVERQDPDFEMILSKIRLRRLAKGLPDAVPQYRSDQGYFNLAENYAREDMLEQAEYCLKRASVMYSFADSSIRVARIRLASFPRFPAPQEDRDRFRVANYLFQAGELKRAETVATSLTKSSPKYERPYLILAALAMRAGDKMKARRLFEQVLKLNPYNSEALLGRADICLEVGDRRIARKTYERARELDYSDSYTRDKLRENFPNRSSLSTTNLGAVLQVPLFIGGMAIQSVAPQFGYGFLDRTGKMVFHGGSHSYYGDEFSEGLLACDRAYLNKTGNCEFCIPYQCGSSFSEGMAKVENRHKFGFIDRSGVCKIDLKFDGAKSFHEGFAPVKVGSSWGYVDSTGNVRIEPDFQDCLPFSNKRAAVKINGKIGFIDRDGNVVVEPKYDFAWSFSEDRAIVLLQNDKSGAVYQYCIDPAGKVVFDLSALQERYGMEPENSVDCVSNGETSISSISEGFAGLTDKSLKEIMFREGLVGVPLGSRWGFIDRTGKVVIEPQFDWVTQFSEGFSGVYKNWEGGFINHDGMMVIPGKYRRVEPFSEGRAAVLPKGNQYRYGFIDSLGKLVIRPGYEGYPRRFRDGLVGVGICNTWP